MHSAEVLSQLRTLSWLLGEARRLPEGNPQRVILDTQIDSVRGRLPLSILRYHDERIRKALPSVSDLNGSQCGNCHQQLPSGMIGELAQPGRFVVCPQCGVLIGSGGASMALSGHAGPADSTAPAGGDDVGL